MLRVDLRKVVSRKVQGQAVRQLVAFSNVVTSPERGGGMFLSRRGGASILHETSV
jgi:hypothetical protein